MKCGACKWYKARRMREHNGKISPLQRLKSGTCHIYPPTAKGWPECRGEDMACREFESQEQQEPKEV